MSYNFFFLFLNCIKNVFFIYIRLKIETETLKQWTFVVYNVVWPSWSISAYPTVHQRHPPYARELQPVDRSTIEMNNKVFSSRIPSSMSAYTKL